MKKILLLLFAFLGLSAFAEKVEIQGIAIGAQEKSVRVFCYSDMISYNKTLLAETTVKADASFKCQIDVKATTQIIIYINFFNLELFVEPGKSYLIAVDTVEYLGFDQAMNNVYRQYGLNYTIQKPEKEELNKNINAFNSMYNDFTEQHFNALYMQKNKALLDSFQIELNNNFGNFNNRFFSNYIKFRMINLDLLIQRNKPQAIISKYFKPSEFDYNNPECWIFFNQYFENYLKLPNKFFTYEDIQTAVNVQKSAKSLLNLVKKDSLLRGDSLKELVLLKGCNELYYDNEFSKQAIVQLLEDFIAISKNKFHIEIAKSLKKSMLQLNSGEPAPEFILFDDNRDSIKLSNYTGNYLCLNFWSTKSVVSVAEFDYLASIYKSFNGTLKFLSVSVDDNYFAMQHFLQKQKYPWQFVHFSNNHQMLEDYDVQSLPYYILIDDHGRILSTHTPLPSEGLKTYFDSLIKRMKKFE